MTSSEIDLQKLVLNLLSREQYDQLSAAGQIQANQLYMVKDQFLDACGNKVLNVAWPDISSDAVNKDYVDNALQHIDMKPLSGQSYDLAVAGKFSDLVIAVAEALGAEVINKPT